MNDRSELKQIAAEYAVDNFITSGMLVGLGFGSTAVHAVHRLADLLARGDLSSVTAIACALSTEQLARECAIPLIDFKPNTIVDVTIDGADEVDPQFNLIKGGGGALSREKILAQNSRREVIVVDDSKLVDQLGVTWPVPIEVLSFGWQAQVGFLSELGATAELRQGSDGRPFQTDQGNLILDAEFGPIEDPYGLAIQLDQRAGIVTHGLFLDLATDLVVASQEGVHHRSR